MASIILQELKEEESNNKQQNCLNCQHQFEHNEEFCPECGQKNINRNISIKDLLVDFFGDYFAFDSKLFNTIKPLFVKPGEVASDFVDGHRVKHIPPLRILIFTSFIFFFVFGLIPKEESEDIREDGKLVLFNSIDITFYTTEEKDSILNEAGKLDLSFDEYILQDSATSDFSRRMILLPSMLDQGHSHSESVDSLCVDCGFFEKRFFTQIGKLHLADKNAASNYLMGNLSLSILFFQPVFAFLLFLFYFKRKKFFINHLVLSLYFHAFMAILFTFCIIPTYLFQTEYFILAGVMVALVYMYFSLKKFYAQKRWITLLKTFFIMVLYLVLLTPLTFITSILISFFFF